MTPSVVSPGQSVDVRVSTAKPISDVSSARIELGYQNFFRYRWAGHADAAATEATGAMWLTQDVGTTYGTDRNTKEWIGVFVAELPTPTSEFTEGSATFRIPSWAPPSSSRIAGWSCRLVVQRRGIDVEESAEFTVVTDVGDAPADLGGIEQVTGSAASRLDIELPRLVFRAGETIDGAVVVTPSRDLAAGDVRVKWQWQRDSHPRTRTPGFDEVANGRTVQLDKHVTLREGAPVRLPFQIALPLDAAPSASAVNSSMHWFVGATMFYAGFSSPGHESVRLPIAVVNPVRVR
ncbi:hypothetical protein PT015_03775 [Candidatus Mycobacterium wuenschmannii]|uniref:Uncharacterized protein n=1 Tax=Candidatus Mycobacterium wuenschmannii TaxID=3027808 RepID=A0ABY8VYB4_9MYCO|nr:hypothetical protein [Candidatus Mycobacterium wuenschmannii]WIM88623.1 hypothetical protein PT015_03775 [Candidatus Mycobacterium wuenschmannii]